MLYIFVCRKNTMIFAFILPLFVVIQHTDCVHRSGGGLVHVLRQYDTLKTTDLRHHFLSRHKRSPGEHPPPYPRQMEFDTLGKHFHLYLEPRTGLLSPKFKAYGVDSRGNVKYEQVDKNSFFTGQVLGEPGSTVEAHLEEDGVLSARVTVGEDIYFIEPSWRHLPTGENVTMISYRARDVKFNFTGAGAKASPGVGFCAEFDDDQLPLPKGHRRQSANERPRRQTGSQPPQYESPTPPPPDMDCDIRGPAKNTCPMQLVADYRFFTEMGQKSLRQTINYLINLIEGVDRIFRCTQWGKDMGGFGFEIKEIKVHEEPTPPGGAELYNMDMQGVTWQVRDLLANFSLHDYSEFCLAHLFTYQDFDLGVLGLGWVGTDRKAGIGGICTDELRCTDDRSEWEVCRNAYAYLPAVYRKQQVTLYLNTGLTSTLNWNRRILTREADLVTAHELGHNFGSEHDTDDPECSPNPEQGGKYIMYQVAVSGEERNNKLFSNCSKRSIYKVLSAKHSLCFVEPQKSLCGNYRVEEGEDCDPGHLGNKNTDPCCTGECKFKGNAVCSDNNSPCCLNCTFAPSSHVCRKPAPPEDDATCKQAAYCTGTSPDCPASEPRNNGTCIADGQCRNGTCMPFCESRGLQSCLCQNVSESCNVCCMNMSHPLGMCKPYQETPQAELKWQQAGKPCIQGYCNMEGKCEKQAQDLVNRFWDIIQWISPDKIAETMAANIVGTVLILSLMFWVPCGCLVHVVDKRRLKKRQLEEEASKNTLVRDEDKHRIKPGSVQWLPSRGSRLPTLGPMKSDASSPPLRPRPKLRHRHDATSDDAQPPSPTSSTDTVPIDDLLAQYTDRVTELAAASDDRLDDCLGTTKADVEAAPPVERETVI
ncbi:ADAM 17-like protease isoform X1 [Branchiostoma floridae x Branchiostoma japonicum]